MKKINTLLLLILLLLLTANTYAKGKGHTRPPSTVAVEKVRLQEMFSTSKLVGTVISLKTSLVGSEVTGLVKKITVEEGDIVKKGSTCVVLKNSQLLIAIKEARAALDEEKQKLSMLKNGNRKAEVNKAKAEADESEILWKRQQQELKRSENLFNKKLLSENEYVNSLLKTDALEQIFIQKKEFHMLLKEGSRVEEIAIQAARVEKKKAQLDFLLDQKKKTRITAPFDGVVVKKFVEEGEWINTGTQVLKIIQLDPIRIEAFIPEDSISLLEKGSTVKIAVDAIPGRQFTGKVSQIIPEASVSSRTFPVRIILPNHDYALKSGMTARLLISYGSKQKVTMIPQDALIISGNSSFVYTLGEDSTAQMVPVKPGRSIDGWIAITGELKESDKVISKGNERLRPGQKVAVGVN